MSDAAPPPPSVWRRVLHGVAVVLVLGGALWIADHLR